MNHSVRVAATDGVCRVICHAHFCGQERQTITDDGLRAIA